MRTFAFFSVVLAMCATSYGDLIMSFTADGSAQGLTTLNVGQSATLDLYLLQTIGEFDTGGTYAVGLVSGGVRLNFGPALQVTAFTEDGAWDPLLTSLGPGATPISSPYADVQTGVFVGQVPPSPDPGPIRLGAVTFQGVAAGSTTVTFSDSGIDMFTLNDGVPTSIDPFVDFGVNGAPFQVNGNGGGGEAVPEPGSIGLSLLVFGAASVVTAWRVRRKRRSEAPAGPSPAG